MKSGLVVTLTVLCMLVSGQALAGFTAADAAELETEATATLGKFQAETSGTESLLNDAKGVLVCPKVTKGGFIVGVESGKCALQVGGETVEHYRTSAAKVGLLAGGQSYSMIMVFNDQATLDKFRSGDREWEVGVDASVAVAKVGESGSVDTTNLQEAVVAFVFGEKGLMADVSLAGSTFKKLEIEG